MNEIEVINSSIENKMACWSPREVMAQINAIQQLMRDGMHDGEHFGKIPGCGDKPALLKPGAEKLGLMFRLGGKYEIQEVNLPNGHLDVKIKCSLYHIVTGSFWGEGIGSCSTMESKYRYRSGVGESTLQPVPKDYWTLRTSNPTKALELLGGKGYTTKKDDDGIWRIYEKVDKVENPDIADTYNTVRKIAKKRAFVDAMLSATAASDIFTQDIDEMFGQEIKTQEKVEKEQAIKAQDTIESQEPLQMTKTGVLSPEEIKEVTRLTKQKNVDLEAFKAFVKGDLGVSGIKSIKKADFDKVIEWLIKNERDAING